MLMAKRSAKLLPTLSDWLVEKPKRPTTEIVKKGVRLSSKCSNLDYSVDILKCLSCWLVCSPPMYKCDHDHLICRNCLRSIQFCPSCNGPLKSQYVRRALSLERFYLAAQLPCRFKGFGCQMLLSSLIERHVHENVCPRRQWLCPDHSKLFHPDAVLPHLQSVHSISAKDVRWDFYDPGTFHKSFIQLMCPPDNTSNSVEPQFALILQCYPVLKNPPVWRYFAYVQHINFIPLPQGLCVYTLKLQEKEGDSTKTQRDVIELSEDLPQLMSEGRILAFDFPSLSRFHQILAKVNLLDSVGMKSRRLAILRVTLTWQDEQVDGVDPTDIQSLSSLSSPAGTDCHSTPTAAGDINHWLTEQRKTDWPVQNGRNVVDAEVIDDLSTSSILTMA